MAVYSVQDERYPGEFYVDRDDRRVQVDYPEIAILVCTQPARVCTLHTATTRAPSSTSRAMTNDPHPDRA